MEVLDEFFGGPNGEAATDDFLGCDFLGFAVFEGEDGFGVSDGDGACGDEGLDVFVEVEEAHGVGDGCARLAYGFGDFLLFHAELASEADVAGGFFDGVEVGALKVFDERHFEDLAVGGFANDDGDGGEFDLFGCTPAAFARDEFEFVADFSNDERLNDAVVFDGVDEFVELSFDKVCAGLKRRGADLIDGDFEDGRGVSFNDSEIGLRLLFVRPDGPLVDEGAESFTQSLPSHWARLVTNRGVVAKCKVLKNSLAMKRCVFAKKRSNLWMRKDQVGETSYP